MVLTEAAERKRPIESLEKGEKLLLFYLFVYFIECDNGSTENV